MLHKSAYVLLGLLSKSPHSGYELKHRTIRVASFYSPESNAQIYPVLKKLEKLGLVHASLDKTSGARNKVIYSITKKGLTALLEWLEKDCDLMIYREEFLLQLSLGQHLTKQKLIKKLTYYRQSILTKLENLNDIVKHIKTHHAGKADQQYLLLTYDHIKALLDAKLKWCDKILGTGKETLHLPHI